MKQIDLMIGSWVFDKSRNSTRQVETEDFYFGNIIYFEAIPLTPKILEKNGFEQYDLTDTFAAKFNTKVGFKFSEGKPYNEGNIEIRIINDILSIEKYNDKYPIIPIRLNNIIKNVHELQQSLIICGIEKEIII